MQIPGTLFDKQQQCFVYMQRLAGHCVHGPLFQSRVMLDGWHPMDDPYLHGDHGATLITSFRQTHVQPQLIERGPPSISQVKHGTMLKSFQRNTSVFFRKQGEENKPHVNNWISWKTFHSCRGEKYSISSFEFSQSAATSKDLEIKKPKPINHCSVSMSVSAP